MAKQKQHKLLIIFDLVSTLTDAGPRYAKAFQEVCAQNGIAPPTAEEVLEQLGNKNLKEITGLFAPGLDAEGRKDFMSSCNNACDALLNRPGWHEGLFPNVREAVETLALRGVTLGIYTGTREDAMQQQLEYHGLESLFDPRYRSGKDNERDAGKSSDVLKAEQLREIVAQFRADAGDENAPVVVIGDSSADAKAAAAQGLLFIGFAADEKKKQKLEAAGVTGFISDFGQMPDLAQRLIRPPSNDNAAAEKPQPGPRPGILDKARRRPSP
ncbi:MAG: HAD hydrolase-like protein [Alphaproteobacteria bacterium]|nr:HAD hydrolase-like protein [Alphaproteobacteria bacterium]